MKMHTIQIWIITTTYIYVLALTYENSAPIHISFLFLYISQCLE